MNCQLLKRIGKKADANGVSGFATGKTTERIGKKADANGVSGFATGKTTEEWYVMRIVDSSIRTREAEEAVRDRHTHPNQAVLDGIGSPPATDLDLQELRNRLHGEGGEIPQLRESLELLENSVQEAAERIDTEIPAAIAAHDASSASHADIREKLNDTIAQLAALTGLQVDRESPREALPAVLENNTIYLVGTQSPYTMWLTVGHVAKEIGSSDINIENIVAAIMENLEIGGEIHVLNAWRAWQKLDPDNNTLDFEGWVAKALQGSVRHVMVEVLPYNRTSNSISTFDILRFNVAMGDASMVQGNSLFVARERGLYLISASGVHHSNGAHVIEILRNLPDSTTHTAVSIDSRVAINSTSSVNSTPSIAQVLWLDQGDILTVRTSSSITRTNVSPPNAPMRITFAQIYSAPRHTIEEAYKFANPGVPFDEWIGGMMRSTMPHNGVGEIFWWPDTIPPEGALVCDHRAINRHEYAELFAIIGTRFGAGNGTNTFNLPDMRGVFVRGFDPGGIRDNEPALPLGRIQRSTEIRPRASGRNMLVNVAWHDGDAGGLASTSPLATSVALGSIVNITRVRIRPVNINLLPCIRAVGHRVGLPPEGLAELRLEMEGLRQEVAQLKALS